MQDHLSGLHSTTVIYRASSSDFEQAYQQLAHIFNDVRFSRQESVQDFKPLTLEASFTSEAPYIMFAVDDIVVTRDVDLIDCVDLLEQTGAYGFYLRLGANIYKSWFRTTEEWMPQHTNPRPDVYLWRFSDGRGVWRYAHTVDMTIYRKSDCKDDFESMEYTQPNQLEGAWMSRGRSDGCGLCYEYSCIVNLPLNRVQDIWQNSHMDLYSVQDLSELFCEGYTIDRTPLESWKNDAPHMWFEPTFVLRDPVVVCGS